MKLQDKIIIALNYRNMRELENLQREKYYLKRKTREIYLNLNIKISLKWNRMKY